VQKEICHIGDHHQISLLLPHIDVTGHSFMIRERDGGLVILSDCVEEGEMEPVCPDYSSLISVLLVEDVIIDDRIILASSVGVPQVTKSSMVRSHPQLRQHDHIILPTSDESSDGSHPLLLILRSQCMGHTPRV